MDEPLSLGEVPCVPGGNVVISWGLGNELFVCDTLPSSSSQLDSTASCVQWGCLPAAQRRIAYDSLGKYQALQLQQRHVGRDARSPQAWADVLDYSQTISRILGADGSRAAEVSTDGLYGLQERALWELLALFFLEGSGRAQSLAGQDLARWLRRNVAAVASPADLPLPPPLLSELREASLPESHPRYWPTLARLVALGWVAEALELLGLHSAWLRWDGSEADPAASAQVAALEAVTLLLRRFPVLRPQGPLAVPPDDEVEAEDAAGVPSAAGLAGRECNSPAELLAYHRSWQAQVRALLSGEEDLWEACAEAAAETAEGLRSTLQVAAGQEAALLTAAHSWPELLVAQLLHAHPATRPQAELKQLLERCYSAAAGGATSDFLQAAAGVLEACCDADAQTAMKACSEFCSDWFMAHAPELMAAHPAGAAVLSTELPHLGGSQVEFYTLEYAASLMPHAPTWQLAAAYLAWCPAHGQAALEALLRRLPLEAADSRRALAAAACAEQQGLAELTEGVWQRQGVLCWQAGYLGAALTCFARCDDFRRTDVALQPLAAAVSCSASSSEPAAVRAVLTTQALAGQLEALPAGSANAALLQVHRLLAQGSGNAGGASGAGSLQAAVEALARLPASMRDSCLRLVCNVVPALPPGALSEREVLLLLEWLQGAEERLPSSKASSSEKQALSQGISISRLALVRSLAAAHMLATCG